MKRAIPAHSIPALLISALLAALCLLAAGRARAEDKSGSLGIGADTSLGLSTQETILAPEPNFPGLSILYQLTPALGIQVIGQFALDSDDFNMEDRTITTIGIGARAVLSILRSDDAHLALIGGAAFFNQHINTDNPDVDLLRLAFEVGVRPEWFITDYFSIHTQVGVTFSIISFDPGMPDDFNGWDLNVFGNANLLGNAGFTFWL